MRVFADIRLICLAFGHHGEDGFFVYVTRGRGKLLLSFTMCGGFRLGASFRREAHRTVGEGSHARDVLMRSVVSTRLQGPTNPVGRSQPAHLICEILMSIVGAWRQQEGKVPGLLFFSRFIEIRPQV